MYLTQFVALVRKELIQTFRDPRMRFQLLVVPLIQLTMFGFAADFRVDRVATVVVDEDNSATSRQHIAAMLADGTLADAGRADLADAMQALDDGSAHVAVLLPPGLEADMTRGETARVQVVLDGTDPMRSGSAASAVARFYAATTASAPPAVRLEPRVLFNPELRTPWYVVPGTAAMQLLMATSMLAAMGLAREKELGNLEQIMVSPIPSWVLVLGKTLPFVGIGLFNLATSLFLGAWLFDVPLHGSPSFLVVSTLVYLLGTLGIGLMISTVSDSQQQAFVGAFLFILPAMLLSGNLSPVAAMPMWLQALTWFNPLRYEIEILRGSLLRDAGWGALWPQLAALTALGTTTLTLASLRFRKTSA